MNIDELPKTLTNEQVDSICMSIRHDFGLIWSEDEVNAYEKQFGFRMTGMTEKERNELRFQVRDFYRAIYKQFKYIEP